jgi:hypothetical protein
MRLLKSCVLVLAVAAALLISLPKPAEAGAGTCAQFGECLWMCTVVPDGMPPRTYPINTCL